MNSVISRLAQRLTTVMAIIMVIAITSSCSSHKNQLTYFKNLEGLESGVIPGAKVSIKIVPEDELSITINSQSAVATAPYNLPMFNEMTQSELISSVSSGSYSTTPLAQTYIVDSKGNINMPRLGEIHVAGMTLEELTDYITDRVSKEVKDPVVRVVLVNFHVNVLGEVSSPKRIDVKSERFSVLDALAAGGDMTQYGVRESVIVIREQPDGTVAYQRLNLRDASIVSSPYYYLQQNDIVYVEPDEVKASNARYNTLNSYKLSTISTIVSAASVIASLVIALTVK